MAWGRPYGARLRGNTVGQSLKGGEGALTSKKIEDEKAARARHF